MYVPEIEMTVKIKDKPNMLRRKISKSKDLYNVAMEIFNADQIEWVEEFIMLCLNRQREVIGYYKVSKGGMASTIVDVKVIATIALQSAAHQVVIMHNHPSGTLTPSEADKRVTSQINQGLAILDIVLVDHLIVTKDSFLSFADEGILYNHTY